MKISNEEKTVTAGGGQYVGIQDGWVYFNDPQTKTTLTVRVDVLTSDAVRNRIAESRALYEHDLEK